ncbi:uncharacterized protein LOC131951188 [Physella acuta]|uniref:uncharacterized protein LOC131951188 n=1 Tax=Physella acuta TaxID=109671 RepID=UPI0027DD086E|nr:uncharacterized protein LOC131951188 [Physella acuta]
MASGVTPIGSKADPVDDINYDEKPKRLLLQYKFPHKDGDNITFTLEPDPSKNEGVTAVFRVHRSNPMHTDILDRSQNIPQSIVDQFKISDKKLKKGVIKLYKNNKDINLAQYFIPKHSKSSDEETG